jgi:putative mRNA 3-end processing factor
VLICTQSALQAGTASNVKKPHYIYVSGWATVEARRTQLGVDGMVPLSDHIDFFELIDFCQQLNPQKIWVTHTPDPKVVLHFLEQKGFDASYLDLQREQESD